LACELRRLVLLLAGLHSDQCPRIVANTIQRVKGVFDVQVARSVESEHRGLRVGCEYGIAQVLFDPEVITSAKILASVEPSYWADVILESPLVVSDDIPDERRRAIFA
jgi:hypothetical protein